MAGLEISLQGIIDRFDLSENQLNEKLSDEHLRKVSRIFDNYEIVGYELGLTEVDISAIKEDERTQECRRLAMLRKWKHKSAWNATYRKLIEALLRCNRADTAEEVGKMAHSVIPGHLDPSTGNYVAPTTSPPIRTTGADERVHGVSSEQPSHRRHSAALSTSPLTQNGANSPEYEDLQPSAKRMKLDRETSMEMAGPGISLKDLTNEFQLSPCQLEMEIDEKHLGEVSDIIADHKILGLTLGLTEQEMTAIDRDEKTHELKKEATLRKWKQKNDWRATYRKFIEVLLRYSRADHARQVCELLKKQEEEVKTEVNDFARRFNEMTLDTLHELEKGEVDPKRVIFLLNLPSAYLQTRNERMKFSDTLNAAADLLGLFNILSRYWDHFNYDLLERLIMAPRIDRYIDHERCSQLQRDMKEYICEMGEFRRKTIIGVYWKIFVKKRKKKEVPEDFEELIENKEEWSEMNTLQDVEDFRREVAEEYLLHECLVFLKHILPGSVKIILWIPIMSPPPSIGPQPQSSYTAEEHVNTEGDDHEFPRNTVIDITVLVYSKRLPFKVDYMVTVQWLKNNLHEKGLVSLVPEDQCIHFHGRSLSNEQQLQEYGIQQGSEVEVHHKRDHLEDHSMLDGGTSPVAIQPLSIPEKRLVSNTSMTAEESELLAEQKIALPTSSHDTSLITVVSAEGFITVIFENQPLSFTVSFRTTVWNLKNDLFNTRLVPLSPDDQCIHFQEHIIPDDQQLQRCGIQCGSEVHVHQKREHPHDHSMLDGGTSPVAIQPFSIQESIGMNIIESSGILNELDKNFYRKIVFPPSSEFLCSVFQSNTLGSNNRIQICGTQNKSAVAVFKQHMEIDISLKNGTHAREIMPPIYLQNNKSQHLKSRSIDNNMAPNRSSEDEIFVRAVEQDAYHSQNITNKEPIRCDNYMVRDSMRHEPCLVNKEDKEQPLALNRMITING